MKTKFTIRPLVWQELKGEANTYYAQTVFGRFLIVQRNGLWVFNHNRQTLDEAKADAQHEFEYKLHLEHLSVVD